MARVVLVHHRQRLERRRGEVAHVERLLGCLVGENYRRVGRQHEVDARVGHQVSLHEQAREVVGLQASYDRLHVQRNTKLFTA